MTPLHTVLGLTAVAALAGCDAVVSPEMREGGFVQLAVGTRHSCALTAARVAYCWGQGDSGQLGDGAARDAATPRRVATTVRFRAVAAGGAHSCALADDGAAYCWGANEHAQSAPAAAAAILSPTAVAAGLQFLQLSAGGRHTCGVTAVGALYCWGANGQGQAGSPPAALAQTPQRVLPGASLRAVTAGGFHTCALDDAAHAWCWGANHYGQLGAGDAIDSAAPRAVSGGLALEQVSAGYLHTCAVDTGARAWCWGSAEHGELGTGGVAVPGLHGALVPAAVHDGSGLSVIGAGYFSSCAVRADASGICWGRGTDAQLGNGFAADAWTPQRVSDGHPTEPITFVQIGAGATHACGLTTTRAIYCWGNGERGQLGAGALRHSVIAVRVSVRE